MVVAHVFFEGKILDSHVPLVVVLVQNHVILLQRLKVKSVQELVGLQMCSAVIGIVHVSINGIGCYDSRGH